MVLLTSLCDAVIFRFLTLSCKKEKHRSLYIKRMAPVLVLFVSEGIALAIHTTANIDYLSAYVS